MPHHDLFRLIIYQKRKDRHSCLSLSTAIYWCDFPCFVSDVHVSFSSFLYISGMPSPQRGGGHVIVIEVVGFFDKVQWESGPNQLKEQPRCISFCLGAVVHLTLTASSLFPPPALGAVFITFHFSKCFPLFNLFRLNRRLKI